MLTREERFFRAIRIPLIVLMVVSAPVSMLAFGLMLKMAAEAWPLWAFVGAGVCIVTAGLGVFALTETRLERLIRQGWTPPDEPELRILVDQIERARSHEERKRHRRP